MDEKDLALACVEPVAFKHDEQSGTVASFPATETSGKCFFVSVKKGGFRHTLLDRFEDIVGGGCN
jgi:hypothetical protein